MRSGVLLALLSACASSTTVVMPVTEAGAPTSSGTTPPDTSQTVSLLAFVDLPRNANTQGLSGTAWDETSRTLYAIQDHAPSILPLRISDDFASIVAMPPIALVGTAATTYDGEGLVLGSSSGFIAVTGETIPLVERFDAKGLRLDAITLPDHFKNQAIGNKGLESLTLSPSGKFLFTANEAALVADGSLPTKTRGTTVRILRHALAGGDEERAYRTEPLGQGTGGDMGISDLAALSDDSLLVMERGYQSDFGNTVRIYRIDLNGAANVLDTKLSNSTPCLEKQLVVDIGALPAGAATHIGREPNPLLDNYEALALGPTLADGRRVLFVTSDDNGSDDQVARVLVLALPLK